MLAKDLIKFIDNSPCSYYATKNIEEILIENGYKKLNLSDEWFVEVGSKCYIVNNDSAIIAFNIGDRPVEGYKLAVSHLDSPAFRVKSNSLMTEAGCVKLNTEVYGGPILSTWLDRPLSLAGRVVIKGKDIFNPEVKLVNIDKDLMTIPNCAIHLNREVNTDFVINAQKHTLPVMGIAPTEENKNLLNELIARELNVKAEDILDCDLYVYAREKGSIFGINNEFISAGRLDNLLMAYVSLRSFLKVEKPSSVNVLICADNEEVGSMTRQGADSEMLSNVLERISLAMGESREDYFIGLENSYMVSADMAHAVHPNFSELHDPTNRPVLGKGPVIKYAANKSYTSDAISASIFAGLCEKAKVNYQKFYNRSDKRGGSTIGPISATHLNIKSVDIGNPMLGMHSVREMCAVSDVDDLYKALVELYR